MEKELSSRDISIDRAQIEQDIRKERQETEERLRGVRGWLLLFVIIVFVNSLIGVLQSLHMLGGSASSTTALLILPWLLLSLYGFLVFVLLVRKHKKAPSHAAKWLIASACYAILLGVLIRTGEMIPALFTAMSALVWLSYLERSRRVALTYLQERQETEERLRGVRGWLLLYVIIVFVISLIGVLQSLHMLGGYISSTTALLILPWLLLSLYGFLVFVLLVRKHKKAPSHAAKWLIASACYAILIGVLIFLRTGEMTPAPFFPAMGAIVLLAYLKRSRRVALTYLKESPMSNQRVDRTR